MIDHYFLILLEVAYRLIFLKYFDSWSYSVTPNLVYYLSVGDQSAKDPGILKLYDPEIEILPKDEMILIFPAKRFHKAIYSGQKERIMIGINFYVIS